MKYLQIKLGSLIPRSKTGITIDMTSADIGDVQPDKMYVGRIAKARLIVPSDEDRAPKIDISISVLNEVNEEGLVGTENGEHPIGNLSDYVYVSPKSDRSLPRLKDFLLAVGRKQEATSKTLDIDTLVPTLPGSEVAFTTRQGVNRMDGSITTVVNTYVNQEEI